MNKRNNKKDSNSQIKPNHGNKSALTKRWREFEYIVKEILTETLENSNLTIVQNILTPGKKDRGTDVDIVIINNSDDRIALTAEAKLRKGSELVLKDFASSLLYFIFNKSNLHCIVTNAKFSPACLEIYDIVNNRKSIRSNKILKFFDATALESFLRESRIRERLEKVEIVVEDKNKISNRTLIATLNLLQDNIHTSTTEVESADSSIRSIISTINEFSKTNVTAIKLDKDSEACKNNVLSLLNNNNSAIITIESQLDSLHNELIDSIIQNYRYGGIVELNLQCYDEFESLYLDLFSQIYGFNLSEMFIKLHKNKIKIKDLKAVINDVPQYIIQILNDKNITSDDKKRFFYFLLNVRLERTLIVFRNIQQGRPDIVQEIINILKKIDLKNTSVIIDYEQNYFYRDENNRISPILDNTIKSILKYRFNGRQTVPIQLLDLTLDRARDFLYALLPNREEKFYNTIIQNYGSKARTLLDLSKRIENISTVQEINQYIQSNSDNDIIEYKSDITKKIMFLFKLMQGHVEKYLLSEFIAQFFDSQADYELYLAIMAKANNMTRFSNCDNMLEIESKDYNCFAKLDKEFMSNDVTNLIIDNFNRENTHKILASENELVWCCPICSIPLANYTKVKTCLFLLKYVQFDLLSEQYRKCIKEMIYYYLLKNKNLSVFKYFADNNEMLHLLNSITLPVYINTASSAMEICQKNMSDFLKIGILKRCLNSIPNKYQYISKNLSYNLELLRLQQKYCLKNITQLLDESKILMDRINKSNNKIKTDIRAKLLVETSKFRYHLLSQKLDYKKAFSTILFFFISSPNDHILLHYQAICLKELYGYNRALKSYRKAIALFPRDSQERYFLNACYFANTAANIVKTDIVKSIDFIDKAIDCAKNLGDKELTLWLGGDRLYYELKLASMKKEALSDDFYEKMNYYRSESDHNAYFTDIARALNIEGIALIYNGEFDSAAEYFEKAFNFAISDAISFIQITVNTNYLLMCTKNQQLPDHAWEYQINALIQKKDFFIHKLINRNNLKEETNYAVLICTLYIAQIFNKEPEFSDIVRLYNEILPEINFENRINLKEYLIDSFFYSDTAAIHF